MFLARHNAFQVTRHQLKSALQPPQRRWGTIAASIHRGISRESFQRDDDRRNKYSHSDWQPQGLKEKSYTRTEGSFRQEQNDGIHATGRNRATGRQSGARTGYRHRDDESRTHEHRSAVFDRRVNADKLETEESSRYPIKIPYTDAASEFLYGYSAVYAALRAGKRRFHKLYFHDRGERRDEGNNEIRSLRALAASQRVVISQVPRSNTRMLDKMSDGRPHNGIILEASPRPLLSLTTLGAVISRNNTYEAISTGRTTNKSFRNSQPFLLFIDDVLDPGNLGAILRSAYFLGVDAVILAEHCAPLNAPAIKASAGAAEILTIYKVKDPNGLLTETIDRGWHVTCATTPKRRGHKQRVFVAERQVAYYNEEARTVTDIEHILRTTPQMLIVGGEGRGLQKYMTSKAQTILEIVAPQDISDIGLDSLNVSVAAAMACNEILSRMRPSKISVRPAPKSAQGELGFGSNGFASDDLAETEREFGQSPVPTAD